MRIPLLKGIPLAKGSQQACRSATASAPVHGVSRIGLSWGHEGLFLSSFSGGRGGSMGRPVPKAMGRGAGALPAFRKAYYTEGSITRNYGRRDVVLQPKKSIVQNIPGTHVPHSQGGFVRENLRQAKRIVIKVGTSVLTRENEFGVSLTRLASLVEQVCALVDAGHEVIIVTSGAVGFGKMRLQIQTIMSQTVRHTLSKRSAGGSPSLDSRACAAAGQSGLMTLYDAMFSQYGVTIAQILVTMSDFQEEAHRANMCETIKELLALGVVPVCNENDVFYSNTSSQEFIMSHENTSISTFNPNFGGKDSGDTAADSKDSKVVRLTANDSLSALLAVELDCQLMVMLTNVDGVYTSPPGSFSSVGDPPKLLHTFNPEDSQTEALEYAIDQRVGRGGMAAKVDAASFALNHGVPTIICNGHENEILQKIIAGKPVGTFFTKAHQEQTAPYVRAMAARQASRTLSALPSSQRKRILELVGSSGLT